MFGYWTSYRLPAYRFMLELYLLFKKWVELSPKAILGLAYLLVVPQDCMKWWYDQLGRTEGVHTPLLFLDKIMVTCGRSCKNHIDRINTSPKVVLNSRLRNRLFTYGIGYKELGLWYQSPTETIASYCYLRNSFFMFNLINVIYYKGIIF